MNRYRTRSILFYRKHFKKRVDRFNKTPISNGFLRVSQYLTIVLTFATVVFAYQTVSLTIKYGEKTDQLDKLQKILATNQNEQTKLEGLLTISQQEQRVKNHYDSMTMRANKNMFSNAYDRLFFLYPELYRDSMRNRKIEFMLHVQTLIESQFTNMYLLEDDTLQKHWIDFDSKITKCLIVVKQPVSAFVKAVGANKRINYSKKEAINLQDTFFYKVFANDYGRLVNSTLNKLKRDDNLKK